MPTNRPGYFRERYAKLRAAKLCIRCRDKAVTGNYCEKCRGLEKERDRVGHRKLRNLVLEAYGGVCLCCGENDLRFLTIDHIDGGGVQQRKSVGRSSGSDFFRWLKLSGFPDGFQVLCVNCNVAKFWGGECPHQAAKRDHDKLFGVFGLLGAV